MWTYLKSLFGRSNRDAARRSEGRKGDAARILEMDEPMAGAGAQVSATESISETEEVLRRNARASAQQRGNNKGR
jgi:hypothetical protein